MATSATMEINRVFPTHLSMLPVSMLLACGLLVGGPVFAQSSLDAAATASKATEKFGPARASATTGNNNSATNNNNDKNIDTGCSRSDWLANKCSTYPGAYPDPHPGGYPGAPPRYRRPIIIVPPPASTPIDDTPLANDWEGCRKTKLNQLNLTQSGNLERANQLDEWLWKNCRSYSEDLRQLEQNRM